MPTAEAQLEQICERWLLLAGVKAQAIRERDWEGLADCHAAVNALESSMTEHLAAARQEWSHSRGVHGEQAEARFQERIKTLMKLEQQNQALLRRMQEDTQADLTQLDQSRRNLSRLRASYVSPAEPAWTRWS